MKIPDQEELQKLYDKGMSTRDLARYYGCSIGPIKRWFKILKIKKRSFSECCKLRCKLKPQTNPGRAGMPKNIRYGKDNPAWKGGFVNKLGYKVISVDGEARLEHRHLWEEHYDKKIPKGHQIHHINGNRLDNRIENLQLMTNSEHQKLHEQPKDSLTKRFVKKFKK